MMDQIQPNTVVGGSSLGQLTLLHNTILVNQIYVQNSKTATLDGLSHRCLAMTVAMPN
jgi:hypothetical protein